jgi:dCMP deaminase
MKKNWTVIKILEARSVAERSKDPTTKVGAILVDSWNATITDGYNGFPRGMDDSEAMLADREFKNKCTVHAEMNLLANAARNGVATMGKTMYCTHHPCAKCAGAIINSGINTVYVDSACMSGSDFFERWKEELALAKQMFKDANVKLKFYEIK